MTTTTKGLRHILSLTAFCALIAAVTIAFADAPDTRTEVRLHAATPAVSTTPTPRVRLAEAPAAKKASKSVKAPASAAPGKKSLEGSLNINIASAAELVKLPGIGPKKAELIVAWRTRHGKFERVVDLRRVKGFGAKSVKKLMPYLAVSGKNSLQ